MKRLGFVLVVTSLALGCSGGGGSSSSYNSGSSSSTTSPSAPSSSSSTQTYSVPLAASSEAPAISNAESTVNGTATITLHYTKDGAGNVSAATVDFQFNATGLQPATTLTMAHIHRGGPGVAGAILVDTGLSSGGASSGSFQKTGVNMPSDVAQGILADPASYYFNVHSALNPGGVARGQLSGGGGGGSDPAPGDPAYGY